MAQSQDRHSRLEPNNEMPRITFRAPEVLVDDLDVALEASDYENRSTFLRAQCRELVAEMGTDTDANLSVDCL